MNRTTIASRKNLRLQGYDYNQPGFYFLTICTKDRRCTLGQIDDYNVNLSIIGSIIETCWLALPSWFSNVGLDEFVVMPNHLHGIVEIKLEGHSLQAIVGSFKSASTRLCRQGGHLHASVDLWQRGYFDHVVRSEKSLLALRQYILDNPVKWQVDELNPTILSTRAMHGIAPTADA